MPHAPLAAVPSNQENVRHPFQRSSVVKVADLAMLNQTTMLSMHRKATEVQKQKTWVERTRPDLWLPLLLQLLLHRQRRHRREATDLLRPLGPSLSQALALPTPIVRLDVAVSGVESAQALWWPKSAMVVVVLETHSPTTTLLRLSREREWEEGVLYICKTSQIDTVYRTRATSNLRHKNILYSHIYCLFA
jgi:hypothetical protein